MKKHQESKHNELKNEHEIILANQETLMQQRMANEQSSQSKLSSQGLSKANDIQETNEAPGKEEIVLLKNKAIKSTSNNVPSHNNVSTTSTGTSASNTTKAAPVLHPNGHPKFGRSSSTGPVVSDKSVDSNVGKLRISNEMKAKLEALTSDQSVKSGKPATREKLNRSLDDIRSVAANGAQLTNGSSSSIGVRKLSEQRKSLLEQQLMGSMRIPSAPASALASSSSLNHVIQEKVHDASAEKIISSNAVDVDSSADGLIKIEGRFAPHRRSLSRETRERKDELGPARAGPMNKNGTIASTVRPEVGDQISLSENLSYFDDQSTIGHRTCPSLDDGSTVSSANYIREIKRMAVPPPPPPNANRSAVATTANGLSSKHHKAIVSGINEENHHPKYRRGSQHHRSAETLSINNKKQMPVRPVTSCSTTNGTMSPIDRRREGASVVISGGEISESSDYTIVRDNCINYPNSSSDKHIQERSLPAVPNGSKIHSHSLTASTFLTYSRVNWELRLRKEVCLTPSSRIT